MDKTRKSLSNGVHALIAKLAPSGGEAVLFGSRARGDSTPESDWDVLVLLDKDCMTASDLDEVSYPIRELGWKLGVAVNPAVYSRKDWNRRRFTPFYKNVMSEGVPL